MRDFQVFIGLANFYQRFIRDFNRIAVLLTLILKMIGSSDLALGELKTDELVETNSKVDDRNLTKKSKNTKSGC